MSRVSINKIFIFFITKRLFQHKLYVNMDALRFDFPNKNPRNFINSSIGWKNAVSIYYNLTKEKSQKLNEISDSIILIHIWSLNRNSILYENKLEMGVLCLCTTIVDNSDKKVIENYPNTSVIFVYSGYLIMKN